MRLPGTLKLLHTLLTTLHPELVSEHDRGTMTVAPALRRRRRTT